MAGFLPVGFYYKRDRDEFYLPKTSAGRKFHQSYAWLKQQEQRFNRVLRTRFHVLGEQFTIEWLSTNFTHALITRAHSSLPVDKTE